MSIADHDLISQRYFFPRRAPLTGPGATTVDVGDARLACHAAAYGHPLTLVHFHGNGEVVADYLPGFAELLGELGVNVFFAEYRGYGGSTGTPRLRAMLDDVEAIAVAACAATGVSPDRLIAFGRSIGSIYAIELASRLPQIAGLVLESGIADVHERILLRATPDELDATAAGIEAEFDRLFDHHAKLASFPGPTLVLHALHDHLVAATHAEQNATSAGARLVLFPRGDHNTIFGANRDAYLEELKGFIEAIGPA